MKEKFQPHHEIKGTGMEDAVLKTRKDALQEFLKKHGGELRRNHEQDQWDIHFSGQNPTLMQRIYDGTAPMKNVEVASLKGIPTTMHVVFEKGEGEAGHNIDVSIQGKALEEFFKFEKDFTEGKT